MALVSLCDLGVLAQSFQTVINNGPSSNRFNIVFLSEGYTAAQLPTFLSDVTNAANAILNRSPFSEYASWFNIDAISVASSQAGSDHPAYGISKATYFNSSYDAQSDYLITIPPNASDTNYSHGQGKIDALLQTYMPGCDLSALLVNDLVQGGSDGFDKTAISYNGSALADVLLHEIGHVMGNLGDEYTNAYPGFPNTEEPNTTQQNNPSLIKWRVWINSGTPVPTPATAQYDSVIGLFQGAHYHSGGWYRPRLDCTMNHPTTTEFCAVCSETLVLSFFRQVHPIDNYLPISKTLTITNNNSILFSTTLLSPATHAFNVQWFTNSVPVPAATNWSFLLLPQTLPNTSQTLSVVVTDSTPLVRNDPTHLLAQTNSWNLTLSVPSVQLTKPAFLSGGRFSFQAAGYAPRGFVVQSSTNLQIWTSLSTNNFSGGIYAFTDSVPASLPEKYFRVKAQ